MPGVLKGFVHRPGGHCGSSAMRDIFEFYGHRFTEEMIFGLGAGLDFMYLTAPEMNPPVYFSGRSDTMEKDLCTHLGVWVEQRFGLSDEEAWAVAKARLDAGEPVMVTADVHYLDYLHVARRFSGHRIVIAGYDEEAGVAYIADNDRDAIQACSLASLRRARASDALPFPSQNSYFEFRFPERLNNVEEAIRRAIRLAVRHMLKPLPGAGGESLKYPADAVLGLPAIKYLAEEIRRWPEQLSAVQLVELMWTTYVYVEKGGTGYGGNFRRIYGRFLAEAGELLRDRQLSALAPEFVAIGDGWSRLAKELKEAARERIADGRSGPDSSGGLDGPDGPSSLLSGPGGLDGLMPALRRAQQQLRELYSREEAAIARLANWLES